MDADHTVEFSEYQLPLRPQAMPAAGRLDLWWLDLDAIGGSMLSGGAVPALVAEKVKARRFASRFLLKMLLGAYLHMPGKDIHLLRNRFGKPGLDPDYHPQAPRFNISHSHRWMLFAISESEPVGVDIEHLRRNTDPLRLARRYFAAREFTALRKMHEADRNLAFIRAWTHKEAALKALGIGLAGNMHQIIVDVHPGQPPSIIADNGRNRDWHVREMFLEDEMFGVLACTAPVLAINARRLALPA